MKNAILLSLGLFLWAGPAFASTPFADWSTGLRKMQKQVTDSEIEHLGLYVSVVGSNQGFWYFPNGLDSSADTVSFDVPEKARAFKAIVKKLKDSGIANNQALRICFAHTHPVKTVRKILKSGDRLKTGSLFLNAKSINPNRRISIPPSRPDLSVIHSDVKWMSKTMDYFGFKNVDIQGLVVDSQGLYYFRPFRSASEKGDVFPELKSWQDTNKINRMEIDFNLLDSEEQARLGPAFENRFMKKKTGWSTHVNHSNSRMSQLMTTDKYHQMKIGYATYTHDVLVRLANNPQSEPPCSGAEFR